MAVSRADAGEASASVRRAGGSDIDTVLVTTAACQRCQCAIVPAVERGAAAPRTSVRDGVHTGPGRRCDMLRYANGICLP